MLGGKQWYWGLVAIVVVVAAFGALVGVSCWHMAYQEASLEAAVREQRTLDLARKSCSAYVAKMLQQQQQQQRRTNTEQLAETSLKPETSHNTDVTSQPADTYPTSPKEEEQSVGIQSGKLMIGLLTSRDVMVYTAQEAIQDLIEGGLVTLQPHLVASQPRQPQETLAGYVERLHKDSGVRVFVGGLTEEEVGVVARWARDRPRPRHPVVLVLLASAPTGWWSASQEEHLEADFAVVSMTPPHTAALPASLLQMQERGVRRVLPLLPDTAAADILVTQLASWNLSSLDMEVLGLVRYDVSVPADEVVAAAGAALHSDGSEAVGVLLTAGPNLADLVTAAVGLQLSQVPWFIATNNLPNQLLDTNKSLLGDIDLNAIEYHENPVNTVARYENISKRVQDKVESTHEVSTAQVYDAVIVASRVGYWLTKDESPSLVEVMQRVSWESSTWAGLTGVLELTKNLERSQGCFTCFHLAVEDSVSWQAMGRIDVRRSAHTITLVSSSADIYVIHEEETYKA